MEDAYTDMCMLIVDQYLTESFDAMELSGQDMNRQYFKDEISPDSIKKAGDIIISFVGQLPQDDMSKMSMAQIAREGESPLLPDIFIRDKILGLQDTDQIDDAIREQQAEKVLPEAALWTLLKAAEDRGRSDLAQFYYSELLTLMTEKESRKLESQMALQQQLTGQPPMGGGPTADPRVAPNAMMGVPPPTPTPQAGAVVPPGTPRPGAQSEEERIRRAGLNGMRGA